MCSAHGTLRGHRQPIVGSANPLPIYGHYSPLIASAALVPIVGCVELRMGTSVALAMGTRWFIFARAFAQRTQTRKGHGARGTGWLGLRKLAHVPCYGCSTVFCTRRPSSGQGRSSPRRPDHNKDSTSRISKNARVATARNTHLWRPAPRTLTGARSHRQPPHVDMMISLNENMSGSGQGGQEARAGEAWEWGVAKPNKTQNQAALPNKARATARRPCPTLSKPRRRRGPGSSEQCIHL